MNIALTQLHAVVPILVGRRHGMVPALMLACVVACASGTVLAGPERERDGQSMSQQQQAQLDKREQPRAERMTPSPQAPVRPLDGRTAEPRADEQRHPAPQAQQQDPGAGRHGRLTPDERRELRRQINEASTDLYPNTPRR